MDHNRQPLSEWKFPLDREKKARNLFRIQQEVRNKRIRKRPSFTENVINQLRFQSWQHWVLQGGVLLAALLLVLLLRKYNISATRSITACSVFLVFAGNICFSSIARLFSRHMAELEKTLYLDLKQMVCIQMMEGGFTDLAALTLLTVFMGSGWENGTVAYLLYLLVPFLWSDIFYLHMLARFRSIFSGFRQLSSGILCGIPALFPAFLKDAYTAEYLPVWGVLSAGGFLLLAAEIYHIFKNIEGGEAICLN